MITKTGRKGVPHENPLFPRKNNSFFTTPYSMPNYNVHHLFCLHIQKGVFYSLFCSP